FDETPIVEVGWRHFELPGEPAQEQKYERFWRLGQIVTAVAGAGLAIRSLEEFSTIYETYWRAKDPRVPGQFVLIATKPVARASTSQNATASSPSVIVSGGVAATKLPPGPAGPT